MTTATAHIELRANSRSRPGLTYRVFWGSHGRAVGCTCPRRMFRPGEPCAHMAAAEELHAILAQARLEWGVLAQDGVVEIEVDSRG